MTACICKRIQVRVADIIKVIWPYCEIIFDMGLWNAHHPFMTTVSYIRCIIIMYFKWQNSMGWFYKNITMFIWLNFICILCVHIFAYYHHKIIDGNKNILNWIGLAFTVAVPGVDRTGARTLSTRRRSRKS